ncbi:related to pyruvate dehydrogenase complex protein X precursor, dihydrolipoamide acetyltransferase component [Moesziomyces antarcticus]|uniref:Related to pyruvate dehydrogenase complex protein X, dihydrolipoamide acetyltransferase component n=1 Tax=Pseudozyma antarctica TaxID=84753 RepID=A0A5C3FYF7_PSEA2|nr:related to pyruvate dehydrogenase complex protein X precursor, dihydrolipoamide acetyltransferase component [Moesziomyces antarcticus]
MDVEAQDDGIMAKIVVQDGAKDVDVGKTIAMIAEEGDDISNVQVPEDVAAPPAASSDPSSQTSDKSELRSTSTPGASSSNAHHHFKGPLFPSVQRLIAENNIEDAETKIKGTGVRGMITKGDVLAFLGKAKTPTGSFKEPKGGIAVLGPSQSAAKTGPASGTAPKAPLEPLTGDALRSLIIGGLASSSRSARQAAPTPAPAPAQAFSQQAVDSALEATPFRRRPLRHQCHAWGAKAGHPHRRPTVGSYLNILTSCLVLTRTSLAILNYSKDDPVKLRAHLVFSDVGEVGLKDG